MSKACCVVSSWASTWATYGVFSAILIICRILLRYLSFSVVAGPFLLWKFRYFYLSYLWRYLSKKNSNVWLASRVWEYHLPDLTYLQEDVVDLLISTDGYPNCMIINVIQSFTDEVMSKFWAFINSWQTLADQNCNFFLRPSNLY